MALGLIAALLLPAAALAADNGHDTETIKSNSKERNAIRKGNKLYEEKRYAEAEVEYKRALEYYPSSDVANYNLALTYIRQGGNSDPNDKNSPINQASQILNNLVRTSSDKGLVSRAYYNLGNLAFNSEDYGTSIEMYKNSLRRNPDDDQARQNLRLAQKKKQEQDQQDDKNKDQDKDKQNKDQNRNNNDENKDKNDKDKQDQQNQQNKPNQNKPQEQQTGMSENNVEQILKAMQDAEKGTQQKVNAAKLKDEQNNRRRTGNQW